MSLLCRSFITMFCLLMLGNGNLWGRTLPNSPGQVWQVSRQWSIEEEQQYATWVAKTVTEDFFLRYHIPVDCADVPYAVRWIYARIAHLPAAATTEDGHLIGHWSTNWNRLPTSRDWFHDRRFRAALLYLLEKTSTRTIAKDTYPIRIDRESIQAGSIFFVEGHAGIVGRIVLDGSMFSPIQTWEATLPRRVTKLRQRSFYSTWPDIKDGTGLLHFRWPVFSHGRWKYPPEKDQPFYSVEQYSPEFCRPGQLFDEAVARRIDPKTYDPQERVRLIIGSIYRYLQERVPLVKEGYRHCRRSVCSEGTYLWEAYSTPNRDDMIAFEISHLIKLIKDDGIAEEAVKKDMEGKTLSIGDGHSVTLNYVVQNYLWFSHDPGDSIEARWGLCKCNTIGNRMRDTLKDLNFIEKKYRTTDPKYADYSRNLRLRDLRDLQNKGQDAGCGNLPHLPLEKEKSSTDDQLQIRQVER